MGLFCVLILAVEGGEVESKTQRECGQVNFML